MTTRIGFGVDAHAFGDDRALVLGGVRLDHPRGLLGHSDADVLCHAIADALLGAASLGDLGERFPSNDEWRGASSTSLLEHVASLLAAADWTIVNVDATLIAQSVRIAPHRNEMIDRIASALDVASESVSVKATTSDGLGFTGRDEGITAMAVALIENVG